MDFSYTGGIERRKFLRLSKKYPLRHSRYVPLNFDDRILDSQTLNIGAGGLLFVSVEKYNLSELLKLEIDIPEWQKFIPGAGTSSGSELPPGGSFVTKAIVTRVEHLGGSNYLVAVNFVGLDRRELWALMFAINKK